MKKPRKINNKKIDSILFPDPVSIFLILGIPLVLFTLNLGTHVLLDGIFLCLDTLVVVLQLLAESVQLGGITLLLLLPLLQDGLEARVVQSLLLGQVECTAGHALK